ncbi:hypothetical protein V8E54_000163 [Elaphomyces granulatus]
MSTQLISFIATDVDLAQGGMWWAQANNLPPIFQNQSTLPKRGGKTTISKMDYSQTIINARFDRDARNPVDKLLQQRHEPPPNRPHQDQLENAHMQLGLKLALVYANLANASVQQHDEIRAGDIVSFRNARFQGHRGTMHQKYPVEVGKPYGIVVDWDGTKKKIHSWEQGWESRKDLYFTTWDTK